MSRFSQGLPWLTAAYVALLSYILADLYAFHGRLHTRFLSAQNAAPAVGGGIVAEVEGQLITRQQLATSMREHLWRRNAIWASLSASARKLTRASVLENLINAQLVRTFRLREGESAALTSKSPAQREATMQQRQFTDLADFAKRLSAQQLAPQSFATSINDSLLDEAWIARQIQPQLNDISTQDLRSWYDQNKETLRIPPASHVAHLFLTRHDSDRPDRTAEIRQIHRQLLAKEKTFTQLAAQYSEDDRTKSIGGDLGWVTPNRMPEDFSAALAKLQAGQFSGPVQTQLGWHILHLIERRPARLPTFEEAQSEITAWFISERREESVRQLLASLRQRSTSPAPSVIYHADIIDHTEPAP